jgi:hypothetical protein
MQMGGGDAAGTPFRGSTSGVTISTASAALRGRKAGASAGSGAKFLGLYRTPIPWTREGDINIAPPSSIVDPDATVRSRFIGHAAMAAARAATGV